MKKRNICIYRWPIIILLFSITISVMTSLFTDKILEKGQATTIALSILGIGFAIFQFWIGEINTSRREELNQKQTEIRRINDIKLSVYSQLFTQSHIIIEDCSKILVDIDKGYLKGNRESKHLFTILKFKFIRIKEDIDNFNNILKTSISFEEIQKINLQMEALLISHHNKENKSSKDFSEIYSQFVTSIRIFTNNMSKELLS